MPTPASAIISRTVRTDVELPADISEIELRQHALETELRQARDRIRHLEQPQCVAGRSRVRFRCASGLSRLRIR